MGNIDFDEMLKDSSIVVETIPRTYIEWDEPDNYTGEGIVHQKYERREYSGHFVSYVNVRNTNTGCIVSGKFFDALETKYMEFKNINN